MKKTLIKSLTLSTTTIAAVSLANTTFADDAVDTTANADQTSYATATMAQELARQVAKQETTVSNAQANVTQTNQAVAKQEQAVADAQSQVATAESAADTANSSLAATSEAAKEATSENIAAASQAITTAQTEVATATSEVATTSTTQSAIQAAVDSQTAVAAQAQAKQDKANDAVSQAATANVSAQEALSKAEAALTDAKAQEEKAQDSVSSIETEIAEIPAKNQKTAENIQAQETVLAKANDELKQANANKSEAIAQANELQAEITAKENDIASVNNSITSLKQKQETAQSQLSGLGTYTLPQSYVDYVNGKSTDWNKALEDLTNASNTYQSVSQYDRGYNDPADINREDSKNLNVYVASLINSILNQLGKSKVRLAEGSLDFASDYTANFQDSNYVFKELNAKRLAAKKQGLDNSKISNYGTKDNRNITGRSISTITINGYSRSETKYSYDDTSLNKIRYAAYDLVDQYLKDPDNFKNITDVNGYLAVSVSSDDQNYYVRLFTIPESEATSETSTFNTTEIKIPDTSVVTDLQNQITQFEKQATSLTNEKNALVNKVKDITRNAENNVTAAQANYDSQAQKLSDLKAQLISPDDLNKELATAKETLNAATKAVEDAQSAVTTATTKAKATAETLASAQGDQKVAQKAVSDAKQSLADLNTQLAQAKENGDKANQDLQTAQAKLIDAEAAYKALLTVKDKLATAQTAYDQAQATLATAKENLATEEASLADLKAKQADAQAAYTSAKTSYDKILADYNKAKDLEEKAKTSIISTLPDGTIVAIPKDAPTEEEKPTLDISKLVEPEKPTKQPIKAVQASKPTAASQMPTAKQIQTAYNATITKSVTQKVTNHRDTAASYKTQLPVTGEDRSIAFTLTGLALIGTLGLAWKRKEN
ncbi:SEC10/PgrA surface exclusion domain-containing protein [Streptococcus caballi]|uniref:SEC10/PgrA surface exclusion domain-containing protein n=1 Tax=Streptococcus caballi TaxID=439220 RepID=UPI0003742165|nr:SEC10/PgrA surface exclusion domain-containing protein [Streptococcus caballi]